MEVQHANPDSVEVEAGEPTYKVRSGRLDLGAGSFTRGDTIYQSWCDGLADRWEQFGWIVPTGDMAVAPDVPMIGVPDWMGARPLPDVEAIEVTAETPAPDPVDISDVVEVEQTDTAVTDIDLAGMNVTAVLQYIAENPAERDAVLVLEERGKARRGILDPT